MSTSRLLTGLDEILQHGCGLLEQITQEQYTRTVPEAMSSSIGAHYRHALEHVKLVLDGLEAQEINYDLRARDVRLETDRQAALDATEGYRRQLSAIIPETMDRPVVAACKLSYHSNGAASANSTMGREIMFAAQHAVHHYALISFICNVQKIALAEGFGTAPATLQHRASATGT